MTDVQHHATAGGQPGDADPSAHPGASVQAGESAGKGVAVLLFLVGFVGALLIGWFGFPKLLYSRKHQPVDFNHALHMEVGANGCDSCHFFREDGTFSGSPTLKECIVCHAEIVGGGPGEIEFFEQYVGPGREVPWLIYSRQPDCVFFSHAAHVKMAGMSCDTCHGPIGESTNLKPYEENRLTGYSRDIWGRNISGRRLNWSDRMKMSDCAACHKIETGRSTSVQTKKDGCFVCHK